MFIKLFSEQMIVFVSENKNLIECKLYMSNLMSHSNPGEILVSNSEIDKRHNSDQTSCININ